MRWLGFCGVAVLGVGVCGAQEAAPAATATLKVDAKLVMVPAVVYDKKGLVTNLTQADFALSVDGKPQTVRYFDRDNDLPLTVGLLVDVSRSQSSVLEDEQKASGKFLESFLRPGAAGRPADRAFVLQFGHSAELLQDVTDSRPLLAAGLKEIGTQAPGAADGDKDTADQNSSGNSNGGNNGGGNSGGGNSGNNGGYGGYGRRGGYPGGGGNGNGNGGGGGSRSHGDRASGGTVLYDAVYLSSGDVLGKQTGRRAVVVLTDGVDRHSKESLKDAIEAAQRTDTVVYAIYYKGKGEDRGFGPQRGGGYGGYDPYGRYPPTTGGSTDPGTYRDPDGKKILERICAETGGRMFEVKGKETVEAIYGQIGEELRAQYRLGFTPGFEAASTGYHPIQLSLTNPADKRFEVQTRDGYYTGAAKAR